VVLSEIPGSDFDELEITKRDEKDSGVVAWILSEDEVLWAILTCLALSGVFCNWAKSRVSSVMSVSI